MLDKVMGIHIDVLPEQLQQFVARSVSSVEFCAYDLVRRRDCGKRPRLSLAGDGTGWAAAHVDDDRGWSHPDTSNRHGLIFSVVAWVAHLPADASMSISIRSTGRHRDRGSTPVCAENLVLLIWSRNRITSWDNDCVAMLPSQAVGLSDQVDKSA